MRSANEAMQAHEETQAERAAASDPAAVEAEVATASEAGDVRQCEMDKAMRTVEAEHTEAARSRAQRLESGILALLTMRGPTHATAIWHHLHGLGLAIDGDAVQLAQCGVECDVAVAQVVGNVSHGSEVMRREGSVTCKVGRDEFACLFGAESKW